MERTGTSRSCPSRPARQVAMRHVVGQSDAVGGLVEGVAGRVHGRGVHRQDDGRLAARAHLGRGRRGGGHTRLTRSSRGTPPPSPQRRESTWLLADGVVAGFAALRLQDLVDAVAVLIAAALAIVLWGALRGQLRRRGALVVEAAEMAGFTAIAVAALSMDLELGRYVVAAGWIGHAAWDLPTSGPTRLCRGRSRSGALSSTSYVRSAS